MLTLWMRKHRPVVRSSRLGPTATLGGLVIASLVACAGDSLPLGPETPGAAEAVPSPMASAVGWASGLPMPTKRLGLVAATVNGIVYAIGGQTEFLKGDSLAYGAKLTKVEAFNPASAQAKWASKAPLPAKRAWPSGAAVISGKIYVPGGLSPNGNPTKTLYVYDPSTNTWSTKAPLPVASARGAAAVINGKLYVLTPTANASLLHRYDPASNTWTARASAPRAHHYPASGVIDGKLYIAGTMNSNKTPFHGTSVYDPATNTWAQRSDMPGGSIGAGSRVIGTKLYLVGGSDTPGAMETSIIKVYDPATDYWTWQNSALWMPTARSFLAAATVNGMLYALGGERFGEVLATNERYTP
jgi:N-acetylneuraminic acid mutarotase